MRVVNPYLPLALARLVFYFLASADGSVLRRDMNQVGTTAGLKHQKPI